MKKALALLAAIVAATPAHSAFVVPETAPAPSKDYTISSLEWRGCVTDDRYPRVGLSKVDVICERIFRSRPSSHQINWKNARRCEDYTPGCVDLEGIVIVDGWRYEIASAERVYTPFKRYNTHLYVKPVSSDIKYQDYKINCLDNHSIIGTLDSGSSEGKVHHFYRAVKFQKDVCDSVFPEPEKDTAYRMKELACNLTRNPEEKKKRCDKFKEWNNKRRWQ